MAIARDLVEFFELDRFNMVLQLRSLRRKIDEGAEEMEMVAAERVFRERLSRVLVREAEKLHVTARELTSLGRLVERACAPKTPEPFEHKPVAPRRRKRRA